MLKGRPVVCRPLSDHYNMTRKESECWMQLLFNVFFSLTLLAFSCGKSFGPKAGLDQKNRVDGFLPVVNVVSKRYVQNVQHCSGVHSSPSCPNGTGCLSLSFSYSFSAVLTYHSKDVFGPGGSVDVQRFRSLTTSSWWWCNQHQVVGEF